MEQVQAYCEANGYNVDPLVFVDFYTAKNWMIGKNKMKDWQAAVRTWVKKREDLSRLNPPRRKTLSEHNDEVFARVRENLKGTGLL